MGHHKECSETAPRDGRMPGMNWLVPCFIVRDMKESIEFYEKAFGFSLDFKMDGPDGKIMHAQMRHEGGAFMFGPEHATGSGCDLKTPATTRVPSGMGVYVYSLDVDALYLRAIKAGAEVRQVPQDMFWGDRMCTLKDPSGYFWNFATNVKPFSAPK